ncbi:MAG: hypothetical protein LKG79_05385 [Furfurilactobacillus sp.]|jgi:hypothetical protein|uniref:hypothetical protein n=1 Tax=Furfurilactobacillus sp. TaxID=2767911 RepID=UPI002583FB0F|nr:hypothetical protein [Furfurilactobacillus sp.]MCH4011646.1 hypothetical protein [Furfurilactobacillus sp.]MCH4037538.1 hypothetical protein [Furfurilactobacillus sp.]MCH4115826.1 hypothetical protein [Furfurilactobacillus sp.]MCI1339898.1 hypothetical protein [Furfurilactobacillus sp.]MCI1386954.1 hypothetical protein [Furfurilactobacillus sp.]
MKLTKPDISNLVGIPVKAIPDVNQGVINNVNGAYLTTGEWLDIAEIIENRAKQQKIVLYDDKDYQKTHKSHACIEQF